MSKCLIAEYETTAAAKVALERLEQVDFTLQHVSVITSATDPAAQHLHDLHAESGNSGHSASAPEGRSTSLGMLIGGSVAAPIAAGTLIGPFVVLGPLVGMAVGAAIGSLLGSTGHWGVHEDVAVDYEAKVNSGSVLLIVHDVSDSRLDDAKRQLKSTDPQSLKRFEVDEH